MELRHGASVIDSARQRNNMPSSQELVGHGNE